MTELNRRKYLADYLFIVVVRTTRALRPFLFVPIITRNLGSEAYGLWVQVTASVLFLQQLLCLRFPSLMTRFFAGCKDDRELSSRFTAAMLLPLLLGGVLLAATVPWAKGLSSVVFGEPRYASYIPPLLVYSATAAAQLAVLAYFLVMNRQRSQAFLLTLGGLGDIAVAVVSVNGGLGLKGMLWGLGVWHGLIALLVVLYVWSKHGIAMPRMPRGREFWVFGGWLVVSHVLFFWAGHGVRYILAARAGLQTVAVFGVAYALTSLIGFVTAPNRVALLPAISTHWNAGRPELARPLVSLAYKVMFLLGFLVLGVLYAYGDLAVALLSDKALRVEPWMLPLLGLCPLGYGFYTLSGFALWMRKRIHWNVLVEAMGVLINMALAVVLIPSLGVLGAILSVVIASVSMAGVLYRVSVRVFRVRIDWLHAGRCLLCGVLMVAGLYVYRRLPLSGWTSLVTGTGLGLVLYAGLALALKAVPMRLVRRAVRTVGDRFGQPAGSQEAPADAGAGTEQGPIDDRVPDEYG